jgi:hypothetical protein
MYLPLLLPPLLREPASAQSTSQKQPLLELCLLIEPLLLQGALELGHLLHALLHDDVGLEVQVYLVAVSSLVQLLPAPRSPSPRPVSRMLLQLLRSPSVCRLLREPPAAWNGGIRAANTPYGFFAPPVTCPPPPHEPHAPPQRVASLGVGEDASPFSAHALAHAQLTIDISDASPDTHMVSTLWLHAESPFEGS